MSTSPPIVLCFSGSDPSGGAGIQADQAAIHNLGTHCVSVITALTIQNTQNVFNFYPTPAPVVLEQANALIQDLPIQVVKLGMLGSLENVAAIRQWLMAHTGLTVVLDPVMVAGGGGKLAPHSMATAIKQQLCPLTTLITPNTLEAHQLAPMAQNDAECAQVLLTSGCQHVLIKGSHADTPDVINMLYNNAGLVQSYQWPRLPYAYHGSGCTLAASIAALLAKNMPLPQAVQHAQTYTWESLKRAYQPGKGQYVPNRYYNK